MEESLKEAVKIGEVAPKDLPAGHVRDEAKAIATDALAERIETESGDSYAFDPSKVQIENEVAQHFNLNVNQFEVVNAVPGRAYKWIRDGHMEHSEITSRVARYLGNGVPGYQLVKGKDPECKNCLTPEGYRRIGDVLLYWVSESIADALDHAIERHRGMREHGSAAQMLSKADRHNARGRRYVVAHEFDDLGPDETPMDRFAEQTRGIDRSTYSARAQDTQLRYDQMAKDAKEGKIHGIPLDRAINRRPR